jgi:hypothetical protein
MDAEMAKRDAEALRYRLIVRLALVAREAKGQGRTDIVEFAKTLRKEMEAIEIAADAASAEAAKKKLLAQVPKIEKLQAEIGLPEHGMVVYPKWLRFAAWTSPALLGLGALAWIIERRSRKKGVTKEAVEQLDESEQETVALR